MIWQFPWHAVALLFAAGLAALMCAIALQRRTIAGSVAFAWLMASAAVWSLTSALEAVAMETAYKVLWSKMQYLGISGVSLLWLVFVSQYTRHDRWLTRRILAALAVIPVFTVVMAITNEWHGLLWTAITPAPGNTGLLIYGHGPVFWLIVVHSYMCLLVATLMLLGAALRSPAMLRWQAVAMLASGLLPWLGNLVYVSSLSPVPGLDLTPVAFTVSGVIVVVTIFQLHLLDLVPVARHQMVEDLVDAVIVVDARNRVIDFNPAARALFDLPAGAVGMPADALFARHPALAARLNQPGAVQDEVMLDGGPPRYLDLRVLPLRDPSGQSGGRLLMLRDITERRRTEQALRETQHWAELVYNSASDVMFLMSVEPDGVYRCVSVNRTYVMHTGLPEADLLGKQPREVLPAPAAQYAVSRYAEAIRQRQPITYEESVEMPTGHQTVETTLTPIFDAQGCCTHLLGVSRDISQRKRTEENLRQARAASEAAAELAVAADRAKSAFLAKVSHEVRTPMNAVLGFAQLLEGDPDLTPGQRNYLLHIERSGEQLLRLVNSLLDVSRFESERLILRQAPFDLGALVDRCRADSLADAAARGLRLDMTWAPGVTRSVVGDPERLRHLLCRALAGAIALADCCAVRLSLGASTAGCPAGASRLSFSISIGCQHCAADLPDLASLFEPQAGSDAPAVMTRASLALCRLYARQMGGDMVARYSGDLGLCLEFDVVLRVAAGADCAGAQPAAPNPEDAPPPPGLTAGAAPARLRAMPPDWRQRLRQVVELGDFETAAAMSERIKPIDPELSALLAQLAYNYDQDMLLHLTSQVPE